MIRISFFLTALALLSACAGDTNRREGPLRVVATTGLVADALKQVAGPHAEITALMGPGVDPHLYKATQGDLARLQQADLIVINGLHLEGKLAEVLERLGRQRPVVALGEALDSTQLRRVGPGGAVDPHIWFDVRRWRAAAVAAAEALATHDSVNAPRYRAAAERYDAQLDSLDRWVQAQIGSIPPERRVLVTAHDAFGYFGQAYGLEVRGLQGLSTAAEFGLRDVSTLVSFLVERRIPAVFVESSVPAKAIEAVVEGCRARGHNVRIGGTLYSDALGAPDGPAATYIGMVTANVNTIVSSLK